MRLVGILRPLVAPSVGGAARFVKVCVSAFTQALTQRTVRGRTPIVQKGVIFVRFGVLGRSVLGVILAFCTIWGGELYVFGGFGALTGW